MSALSARPSLLAAGSIASYVAAMLAWRREQQPGFSLRGEAAKAGLSHSLVSRIASGQRSLTRDQVDSLSGILGLNAAERMAMDRAVATGRTKAVASRRGASVRPSERTPKNHLLTHWLNVYVKDAAKLRDFRPDPAHLYGLLGGIASVRSIARSLNFLLFEGFLRTTPDGRVVPGETMVVTSDGVPSSKIRAFHKQALAIARRHIDLLPTGTRLEYALILHLNDDSIAELKELLREFYQRLLQFAEEHPQDDQRVCQVLINFTPLSFTPSKQEIPK